MGNPCGTDREWQKYAFRHCIKSGEGPFIHDFHQLGQQSVCAGDKSRHEPGALFISKPRVAERGRPGRATQRFSRRLKNI
jgi:hypothetical protein